MVVRVGECEYHKDTVLIVIGRNHRVYNRSYSRNLGYIPRAKKHFLSKEDEKARCEGFRAVGLIEDSPEDSGIVRCYVKYQPIYPGFSASKITRELQKGRTL